MTPATEWHVRMTKDPRTRHAAPPRRLARAPGFVPVETKLLEPEPLDRLVPRGQSIDLLRESADVPVVLVTAPPGYGKTSLVRQWADEDERPFAWLSLDATDNDPMALVIYIVLALQRLEEVDPA